MKFARFVCFTIFLVTLVLSYNQQLYPVEFFDLFSEKEYTSDGLRKVREFNSEETSIGLPDMNNKEFFDSINDLSICRNSSVREFIYLYLTTGREYTIRSIERSHIYLDIVKEIMSENPDIPADISLLPLLESGFEPNAVSKSNAVGLWQFLYSTSSHLGLKSNRWVEERRDIEKSTRAAIRHLRYLKKIMKSWELALAAYNGGQGQLSRAIKRSGTDNLWTLAGSGALTRETSEYIPRFAALVIIYKHQRLFGIHKDINLPETDDTLTVKPGKQLNLSLLSQICGIEQDEIFRYNPELNGLLTPPAADDYTLRLTVKSAGKYFRNRGELAIAISSKP